MQLQNDSQIILLESSFVKCYGIKVGEKNQPTLCSGELIVKN